MELWERVQYLLCADWLDVKRHRGNPSKVVGIDKLVTWDVFVDARGGIKKANPASVACQFFSASFGSLALSMSDGIPSLEVVKGC